MVIRVALRVMQESNSNWSKLTTIYLKWGTRAVMPAVKNREMMVLACISRVYQSSVDTIGYRGG
jgi:hypothetical protein